MFYTIGQWIINTIAWLDFILATTLLYILSFLPKKITHRGYPYLFRRWCWIFIRALGVKLHIHQKYRNSLPQHYIVIANHPSVFEDIGMSALFPAYFLAKAELKKWWILGRISNACGTLYVQRDSKQSRKQATLDLLEALKNGKNIGLYPEGGCKGRRVTVPFQYGIFDIAMNTGVPIVPVFLHYEAQEAFEWGSNESLLQKVWKISISPNKHVHYYIFDAIDPKDFANKESLTLYMQNLYLTWQAKYLE